MPLYIHCAVMCYISNKKLKCVFVKHNLRSLTDNINTFLQDWHVDPFVDICILAKLKYVRIGEVPAYRTELEITARRKLEGWSSGNRGAARTAPRSCLPFQDSFPYAEFCL